MDSFVVLLAFEFLVLRLVVVFIVLVLMVSGWIKDLFDLLSSRWNCVVY